MSSYSEMTREQLESFEKELLAMDKRRSKAYADFLVLLKKYKENESNYSEKEVSFFIDSISKAIKKAQNVDEELQEEIRLAGHEKKLKTT
ncbi:hypothetical protein MHB46_02540 [Paenibacillus sp. FSL H7-0703]|uniref:hypothetical protein n=1 Tax=Paenibacillus sp. FSL H7-0703 TaxID=2921438 RepID=UPI0030F7F8EF